MPKELLRIGIHGDTLQEVVERPLGGMLRFAREHGRNLLCDFRMPLHEMDDFRMADPPWTGRVDGAALSFGFTKNETPDQAVQWIKRGRVPVVSTSADILDSRIPTVCLDVDSIARLAADHLLQCGCRRFLHVGFVMSMGSGRRAEAFRKVLAEKGFELAEYDFVAKVRDDTDDRCLKADARNLAPLLTASPHPLGILALGDPFARAVWRTCDSLGLRVPEQVAIVGVNDTPLAFAQRPTLTSICYPGEEVGYRAITLLVKLIAGGRRPRELIEVPAVKLAARESTTGSAGEGDEMAKALEMIRRQAYSKLTTEDLAAALSVSRRWLELEFRKHLGRSPGAERQRVRLVHARELLELTDLPLTIVAEMTGFSEIAALAHFFHRHTGFAPSEYRRWAHAAAE